jgi:superkiller protein 3
MVLVMLMSVLPRDVLAQSVTELSQKVRIAKNKKDYAQAERLLYQLIEREPGNGLHYLSLCNVLDKLNQAQSDKLNQAAISACRRAVELRPLPYYENFQVEAWLSLGGVEQDLERRVGAYRKALALPGASSRIKDILRNVQEKLDSTNKRIANARKNIDFSPNDPYHYVLLGQALSEQGKYNDEILAYCKALSLPDNMCSHAVAPSDLSRPQVLEKSPGEESPLDPSKRSVVMLTISFPGSKNDPRGGTGFIVKRDQSKVWILTNRHVVFGGKNTSATIGKPVVEVTLYHGQTTSSAPTRSISASISQVVNGDGPDLALLESNASDFPENVQPLLHAIPISNESITVIGNPPDNTWKVDQGKVIGINDDKLVLSISLKAGNSGSPVLNKDNKFIGIITKIDGDGNGYAIPIRLIVKQLKQWEINLQ